MGRLTTHVLDTEAGRPAAGLEIVAFRIDGERAIPLAGTTTNADGRVSGALVEGAAFIAGTYELRFGVGAYLRSRGRDAGFLDIVVIRFGVTAPEENHHVPLLLQAHGYATYRGS